jgi:pyrroloquinoline quinone (PQQ) biosynthesis protein C
MSQELMHTLVDNKLRAALIGHRFFQGVKEANLTKPQVSVFLAQWWHPLHYFPMFLSRLISNVEGLALKTAISKILWQELGEGDVKRAHEEIYISTMTDVGFARAEFVDVAPFESTAKLVKCYEESSASELRGLGFLYGTEVADLAMVSGIGRAVRKATGASRLPWVTIHAQQEPGHVDMANVTLEAGHHSTSRTFSEKEQREIILGAEEMWSLWIEFFSTLDKRLFS